jgi:hypothetical protein
VVNIVWLFVACNEIDVGEVGHSIYCACIGLLMPS